MRAAVTGGAGFLGSHLCEALLQRGYGVIILDNLITGDRKNVKALASLPGFEFLERDICDGIDVEGDVDIVFHLASPASPSDYLKYPIETLRAGTLGTLNCLEFAEKTGCSLLLASTSEVYGDPLEHPQSEEYWGNVNPVGVRSVYDEAKRASESITMAYHRERGVRVRIARIFNTYGPRMKYDDGRVVPNFIVQALLGEDLTVFGDGTQTRSFCFVSDLIEGLLKLAGADAEGPVNLGNPQEVKIIDFARLVLELTRSKSRIVFEKLPIDDPRSRRPDISKAKKLLGWSPHVDLRTGLEQTIEWFGENLPRV
ncbi:MAG: UDP-glucuronic acid decarboxylase family protein [bacterium]